MSAGGYNATDPDAANKAKTAVNTLKSLATQLKTQVSILKNSYVDLAIAEQLATGNTPDTAAETKFDALTTTASEFETNVGALENLVKTFDTAEDNYNTSQDELSTAKANWLTALTTYNDEVGSGTYGESVDGATKKYTDTLANDVNEKAWDTHLVQHVSENCASAVVPVWSALNTGNDPVISGTTLTTLQGYTGNGALPTGVNIRKINTMPADTDDTTKVQDTIGDNHSLTDDDRVFKNDAEWKADVTAKATAVDVAQAALDDAKQDVDSASNIKFYINLAEDYADYWTFDTNTDNSTQSDFYLKKILTAGETSHKLVDSVTFANDVTPADYRNLTFDLDIALNSAQATYEANNYSTDAVDSDENFKMVANVTSPATEGSNVTWGNAPVEGVVTSTYSLKVGENTYTGTLTKLSSEEAATASHSYKMVVNIGGDDVTFYGDSNQKNTEFVRSDDASVKGSLNVTRA